MVAIFRCRRSSLTLISLIILTYLGVTSTDEVGFPICIMIAFVAISNAFQASKEAELQQAVYMMQYSLQAQQEAAPTPKSKISLKNKDQ